MTASDTGTTNATQYATIAPNSATYTTAVQNVATALGVSPATITGDTSGYYTAFFSYLASQGINASTAPASTISAASSLYAGNVASATSTGFTTTDWLLLAAAGIAVIFIVGKK